jgi:hypothetical protein
MTYQAADNSYLYSTRIDDVAGGVAGVAYPLGTKYNDFTPPLTLDGAAVQVHPYALDDVYGLSKGITTLSYIDGIYLILCSLLWGPFFVVAFLVLAWGPAAGFVAGKRLSLFGARIYAIFYILKLVRDLSSVLLGNWLGILFLLADVLLGRLVWMYASMLSSLTEGEIELLRTAPSLRWGSQRTRYFVLF